MTHKSERQFGFLFAAVFAVAAFWPPWRLHAPNPWWLAGAGLWLLAALAVPTALAPLRRVWMAFSRLLGWINTRILLGIAFLLVVTPIGLLLRISGKDPLRLRTPESESWWVPRGDEIPPPSLRNQF